MGRTHNDVIVEAILAETLTSILAADERLVAGLERAANGARWRAGGRRVAAIADDEIAAAFESQMAPLDEVDDDSSELDAGIDGDEDSEAIDRIIV